MKTRREMREWNELHPKERELFEQVVDARDAYRAALVELLVTFDAEWRAEPGALETARMLVYPDGEYRRDVESRLR